MRLNIHTAPTIFILALHTLKQTYGVSARYFHWTFLWVIPVILLLGAARVSKCYSKLKDPVHIGGICTEQCMLVHGNDLKKDWCKPYRLVSIKTSSNQ